MKDLKARNATISLDKPSAFGAKSSTYSDDEKKLIRRKKGVWGQAQRGDNPNARHIFKIFYNEEGRARLFYKINGDAVRFIQNSK